MSRTLRAALAAAAALAVAAGPAAAAAPSVAVTPTAAKHGQRVTSTGANWGLTEFCNKRAVVSVGGVMVANPLINPNTAKFSASWRVPASVASGPRRVRVRQTCERGSDGSLFQLHALTWIFVKA